MAVQREAALPGDLGLAPLDVGLRPLFDQLVRAGR
jgi:hypothetical protein